MKNTKVLCIFINISDEEKPKIECPLNQNTETEYGQETAVVEWKEATASDNSGEAVKVLCTPPTGSNFTIGQTEVVCAAVDKSGNNESCGFNVSVCYGMYKCTCATQNKKRLKRC